MTVLKTADLHDGHIDYDNALKVSQSFFSANVSAHVHRNDILVASTGYVSMGKIDIYDRDEPAMVDGHISIVRVKEGYDSYFVAYFLRSHFGKLQFDKWFSGSSGQIELQPGDLAKFVVPDNSENGVPLNKQQHTSELITERLKESQNLIKLANEERRKVREKFTEMLLSSNQV